MFKKIVAGLLCTVMLTAVATGCSSKPQQNASGDTAKAAAPAKKVVLKVGYENNPGEPLDLAAKEWSKLVKERSKDTIELQLFPSSQLGNKKDATEQMLMGSNVAYITDPSFLMDYVPDMGILSGPYLVETYDQLFKLFKSDWYKGEVKKLEAKGLTILADNWIYGDRHTIADKPVRKPEDLKGLKIRIPNNALSIKTFENMGGTPTPMALGEVYTALAQGVINGAENPLPVIYGAKLQEKARYLSLTEHQKMVIFWISSDKFMKSIPAEQADIIRKAGIDAGLYNNKTQEENEKKALEDFKKAGVEIITNVDKKTFRENTKKVYGEFPQWSKGLYEKIQELIK
jgi:tripartite ATP-independent transporter DctP family solute receptor